MLRRNSKYNNGSLGFTADEHSAEQIIIKKRHQGSLLNWSNRSYLRQSKGWALRVKDKDLDLVLVGGILVGDSLSTDFGRIFAKTGFSQEGHRIPRSKPAEKKAQRCLT